MLEINNLINQAVTNAEKRREQALASTANLSNQQPQQVKGRQTLALDPPIIVGLIYEPTQPTFPTQEPLV